MPDSSAAKTRFLSDDEVVAFGRDGFLIKRNFFKTAELAPLVEACRADPDVEGAINGIADSQGNMQEVVGWVDTESHDILSVIVRLARVVEASEQLLGQPVYHWHSKLSMKRPGSLGRWDWHQDYAYWYHEGCLYPDLLTVTIPLDRCAEDNGTLKFIRGSHLLGRIEHPAFGEASAVDPQRLALIEKRHETVTCEVDVGDVIFFHANTLHASGPNKSDRARSLLHISYNTIANDPFIEKGQEHHKYRPLNKLPDSALTDGTVKSVISGQPFFSHGGMKLGRNAYGYRVLKVGKRQTG